MRPELQIRTPTESDASVISAICNEVTRELYDAGDVHEREVRSWFALPDLGMFLAERGGRAVGYVDVGSDGDGARFPLDLRVALGDGRREVAANLIRAAERWAAERGKPDSLARGYVAERDHEVARSFVEAGYHPIRHSFHMEIDLPKRPEEPDWPEGVSVRSFDRERDEAAVYECVQESFADHWDYHRIPLEEWRRFSLLRADFDAALWWLAEADGSLAAVCLNAWHFSGDRTFGWVGTLGVRRPWRRRGLALALLLHSFADFKHRGATRVGLGVDAENTTGAVRLYERAGMRPVRRHDTYEKALAPVSSSAAAGS